MAVRGSRYLFKDNQHAAPRIRADLPQRQDSHVKSLQFFGVFSLVVLTAGCASKPSFPFLAKRDSNITVTQEPTAIAITTESPAYEVPGSVVTTASVKQADMGAAESTNNAAPKTSLVSAMTSTSFTQPTLMTLPKGADLSAQINGAPGTVVLDFYADWCGPCQTQGKILHEMEGFAAANKTHIIKVNIDEHPEIKKQLAIESLPTLIVMKNSQISERVTGLTQRDQIEQWIKQ